MPTVSIIVPVYNVEKYLRECLDSILDQTFKDFELILVDDGSNDKSGEICDEYAEVHSNITVVHQKNQGQAAARNKGVKISKADWIMFVDSDDVIHPQLLQFLIKSTEEENVNISACYIYRNKDISDDFMLDRTFHCNKFIINDESLSTLYLNPMERENDVYWLVLPKLIRKTIIRKNFFIPGRIFEDNEVACKWLVESGTIAIVPEDLYFYRQNPTSTMHTPFSEKKLDFLWALEQQIDFYHKIGYKRILELVIIDYFNNVVYFGKRMINELNDTAMCRQLMRKAEKKEKVFLKYCSFDLDQSTRNFITKYSHPIKFKLNKKINGIMLKKEK